MGTLTLTYTGSPGGTAVNVSASATISDADAVLLMQWGEQVPPTIVLGKTALTTPQQIITAIAKNMLFKPLVTYVTGWKRSQAANAAAAAVPLISVT